MGLFQSRYEIDPRELLRENTRRIRHAIRGLEISQRRLTDQKNKIAKMLHEKAARNEISAIETLANNYNRVQQGINQLESFKGVMHGAEIKLQCVNSVNDINVCMAEMTMALEAINGTMDIEAIKDMTRTFQKETFKSDVGADMMSSIIDQGFTMTADDNREVAQQVLDEIGISLDLQAAPTTRIGSNVSDPQTNELQKRLEKLKK